MKLYKLIAADNQKAIQKVNDTFGPEALIYSTHQATGGVEILLGLPDGILENETMAQYSYVEKITQDTASLSSSSVESKLIENLNRQVKMMDKNIQDLLNQTNHLYQILAESMQKKKWISWEQIKAIDFDILMLNLWDKLQEYKQALLNSNFIKSSIWGLLLKFYRTGKI